MWHPAEDGGRMLPVQTLKQEDHAPLLLIDAAFCTEQGMNVTGSCTPAV